MSIVSKLLVVFTVVMALGFSTLAAVYAYVQPNYKESYEKAVQQAEAANAINLNSSSDRFAVQPQQSMELAARDAQLREMTKALDEKNRELEALKVEKTYLASQLSKFVGPLADLNKEVAGLREQLTKSQDLVRTLNVQTGTLVAQVQSAEKLATTLDTQVKITTAKNQTLTAQNRSQDERIKQLELKLGFLERQLEDTSAALALIGSEQGNVGTVGQGAPEGILGATGSVQLSELLSSTGRPARSYIKLAEDIRIRGKVTDLRQVNGVYYLMLNIGEDDKLKFNDKLEVFQVNPPKYIGRLTVTRLDTNQAAGRLDLASESVRPDMAAGLEVTNNLRTLR